ncbi:MAG: rod shape-determining protein MreC [Firmicutes bacterium]|nr:rod shape-determining protein MreC [Bacillota bacterium]
MFQLFLNRRLIIIALIFLLLTWVMFVTRQREQEGKVEYFLNTAMLPLESILNSIGYMALDSWNTISQLAQLKRENDRLRLEIDELKTRQTGLDYLKAENERLREALQFQSSQVDELISVEVIARNPNNWNSTLVINKGRNFQLTKNMAVIAPGGVVGRIGEVRATTAVVILITDPRPGNIIGGVVKRTQDMALVTGGGHRGECMIQPAVDIYFSDLRKNDLVITSSTSEVFPRGVPIGRVVGIYKRQNKMVAKAFLKPAVDLNRLQILYVIKSKNDSQKETKTPGGPTHALVNP